MTTAERTKTRNHTRRWRRFVKRHGYVADRVLQWLRFERDDGADRLSMAACWEALRKNMGKGLLDNSLRRPAGLWAMRRDPSLRPLITVKAKRWQRARRVTRRRRSA